jgi:hypothetical protein
LSFSVPVEITRVMVGRIELVTPEQRNSLRQIAQLSANDIAADAARLHVSYDDRIGTDLKVLGMVSEGRQSLAAYGVSVPESYQLYLALGRFRNALILDEARRRPGPGLNRFISTYQLEGYKPVAMAADTNEAHVGRH